MKQLIIVRKDLCMSAGKVAAQVAHASMAFLSADIHRNIKYDNHMYHTQIAFSEDEYEDWFMDSFTKIICEAKNKSQLLKAAEMANTLGLKYDHDYFFIWDVCRTEITPEEVNELGAGRTLTCIGFRPLPDNIYQQISKKYQLYS